MVMLVRQKEKGERKRKKKERKEKEYIKKGGNRKGVGQTERLTVGQSAHEAAILMINPALRPEIV